MKIIILALINYMVFYIEDPYRVLNLKSNCNDSDIQKAFSNMKEKYSNNTQYFSRIERAYNILMNRAKRQIYDIKGGDGLYQFERHPHSFRRGPIEEFVVYVTLKEAYLGTSQTITFRRTSICNICKGKGAAPHGMHVCPHCNGQGETIRKVRTNMGYMQFQETCQHCGGRGQIIKERCNHCGGHKIITENKTLSINISKGVRNNEVIIFEGEGSARPEYLPGDVKVIIRIKPHDNFQRDGNDLIYNLNLTLKEAIKGFSKKILHLDNRWVDISKKTISNPGTYVKINGEGMPSYNSDIKGDLLVKLNIAFPKRLTNKAKEILTKISKSAKATEV